MPNIKVPNGMMEAVVKHHPLRGMVEDDPQLTCTTTIHAVLEAALLWLSENPIVPTEEQKRDIALAIPRDLGSVEQSTFRYIEWQRRMFLVTPDPVDRRWMAIEQGYYRKVGILPNHEIVDSILAALDEVK